MDFLQQLAKQDSRTTSSMSLVTDPGPVRLDMHLSDFSASDEGDSAEADIQADFVVRPGEDEYQRLRELVRAAWDRPHEYEVLMGRVLGGKEAASLPLFVQQVEVEDDFETGDISIYLSGSVRIEPASLEVAADLENQYTRWRQNAVDISSLRDVSEDVLSTLARFSPVAAPTDGWQILLVKRRSAYIDFVTDLRNNLATTPILPSALLPFVARNPSFLRTEPWVRSDFEIPRFPDPTNREQREVLRQLAISPCVAVQGPPGTGKSYTIRNLLAHLLATGRRVLVTSQKKLALDVLVNDQMKPEIRELCFVVGDRTPKGKKRVSDQIEAMERNISAHRSEVGSRRDATANRYRTLSDIESADRDAYNELLSAERSESEKWESPFGILSNRDVALRIRAGAMIPDQVGGQPCPLNESELVELVAILGSLSDHELNTAPDIQNPPVSATDDACFARWREIADLEVELEPLQRVIIAISKFASTEPRQIEEMVTAVDRSLATAARMTDGWVAQVVIDEMRKSFSWSTFLSHRRQEIDRARMLISQQDSVHVTLPDSSTEGSALRLISTALEGPRSRRAQKRTMRHEAFPTKALVNDAPPATWGDIEQLSCALTWRQTVRNAVAAWNTEIGDSLRGPRIDEPNIRLALRHLSGACDDLAEVIRWACTDVNTLNERLVAIGLRPLTTVSAVEQLRSIQAALLHHSSVRRLDSLLRADRDHRDSLRNWCDESEGPSLAREIVHAHDQRDESRARTAASGLQRLLDVQEGATRARDLHERLSRVAPKWAQALRDGERLEDTEPLAPWRRRQARALLGTRRQQALRNPPTSEIRSETGLELARLEALTHLSDRLSDEDIRYLRTWSRSLRKRSAPARSDDDDRELARVLQLLPAVIMPIEEVIRTFRASDVSFDVIIIDESSQCDLRSLALLGLADRAIIVGDDKQISPTTAPTAEVVRTAQVAHLANVPTNASLARARSLYDAASLCTPLGSTIELVEHFRCQPEIIQFSNRIAYDGRIRPLRLDGAQGPVVAYKVDGRRGRSREDGGKDTNAVESKFIAEEVGKLCAADPDGRKTIGIIPFLTSNLARFKRMLLKDLRERLGPTFDDETHRRKIEIKSALDFQGDERSIIFIALIVDAPGNAMSGDGHRQRMNVAVSRAMDHLCVVHSADPSAFHEDDVRGQLLRHCIRSGQTIRKDDQVAGRVDLAGVDGELVEDVAVQCEMLGLDAIVRRPSGRLSGIAVLGSEGRWGTDRAARIHRARGLHALTGGVQIVRASERLPAGVGQPSQSPGTSLPPPPPPTGTKP